MSFSDFALMTLFNTTVCILLPRIITLNWSDAASKAFEDIKQGEKVAPETISENAARF